MKITKYTKLTSGKYKVILEDNSSIFLYEDIILNNNLLLKKQIEDIEKIKQENNMYEIYYISKKYINKKYVSKKELKVYLKKKKYLEKDINETIKKLEENNILDEKGYCRAYINDKLSFSNDGPNKIKKNLLKNGISEELIDDVMEIDFKFVYNKLNNLIDKKIKTINNYSGNVLKQKLIHYFINLGYDQRIVEEILINKDLYKKEEGIKEYNKLLKKYSNKYYDYELENIIRQKLYVKGFKYDEIKKQMK